MGTGGGEFLASLAPLPMHTSATEAYPPNVEIARAGWKRSAFTLSPSAQITIFRSRTLPLTWSSIATQPSTRGNYFAF